MEILPPPLSAKDPNCFAYPTFKDRVPVILSKVVDFLTRSKDAICEKYGGEAARQELKTVIGAISQLRYEVMTNKEAAPIRGFVSDVAAWNRELEEETERNGGEAPKWFDSPWLWMECYVYRRLHEAVSVSHLLKDMDLFGQSKEDSFTGSYKAISTLTMYLIETKSKLEKGVSDSELNLYFTEFLQISLWGNRCDLSISAGADRHQEHCPLEQLKKLKPNLLVDKTLNVLTRIQETIKSRNNEPGRVDIVLDNAGFELMTDLCLADFLLAANLASSVHFHAKKLPWFVSDVTENDFRWLLQQMGAMNHIALSKLHQEWKARLKNGSFVLDSNDFWTLPNDFSQMKEKVPQLYDDLAKSDIVLFKGDLNFRKLVGDLTWSPSTDFTKSLRDFQPTSVCSLRTLKCDCVVGLGEGQAEEIEKLDPKWMLDGKWAFILLSS